MRRKRAAAAVAEERAEGLEAAIFSCSEIAAPRLAACPSPCCVACELRSTTAMPNSGCITSVAWVRRGVPALKPSRDVLVDEPDDDDAAGAPRQ